MKATLKLYATLADYLPPGSKNNQMEIEVAEDEPIAAILDRFKLPGKLTHLVLVNGAYVEPGLRPTRCLQAGDQLAVWPPIAGG
jgi:sulfur carrier protein ThiS